MNKINSTDNEKIRKEVNDDQEYIGPLNQQIQIMLTQLNDEKELIDDLTTNMKRLKIALASSIVNILAIITNICFL